MKARLFFPALALLSLLTACGAPAARPSPSASGDRSAPVTVILATDLHYLAPELTDDGPFFTELIAAGDGKVVGYSPQLIDAFLAEVVEERPDALILSGDLTLNGEAASHRGLAAKLASVSDAGVPVLVLPGNHDLSNPRAYGYEGGGAYPVESVTAEEFSALYEPFGYGSAQSRDGASLSYSRDLGSLRVVMLDANTAPAAATLSEETYPWLESQLQDAASADLQVLTVSHQNLLQHNAMFRFGYVLGDAPRLTELLERYRVPLHLSGHMHLQHTARSGGGVWEAATSSLAVSPNQYAVVTFAPEGISYETRPVDVSAWARAQGLTDPALLDFSGYSSRFFYETSRSKALSSLDGSALTDERKGLMADTAGAINAAYFAGTLYESAEALQKSAGYLLWQSRGGSSSFRAYLQSVLEPPLKDENTLFLPRSK